MGRTSRSHSSRLRIAALTADNLAALEPRRRSDPRGAVGGASAGPPACTLLCKEARAQQHTQGGRTQQVLNRSCLQVCQCLPKPTS